MEWLHSYDKELQDVFAEARQRIAAFPEPLNTKGLAYLEQFNVFQTNSHKNYICYLLPFWFREGYGLSNRDTSQMAVGNVLIMLYFFLQDDLMDSSSASAQEILPLANLLYIQFLQIYMELFAAEPVFWSSFGRYITEWADSVSRENMADYFLTDQTGIARKASPLKLSSTAALLLSGQGDKAAEAECMLDTVLLTLQLLDDYEDWEEDLTEGSYNTLLAMVRNERGSSGSLPTSAEVREFIFTSGGLQRYMALAQTNQSKLATSSLNVPHLLAFHQALVSSLLQISAAIEEEKLRLKGGGLFYWLSKQQDL
ncbi:hypothetical protein [Paenibacillus donghaensis]|uniref:Uncharacterized protein n=1 Tax=Paenibacillus donghaensis TaxID=414771 RepID=A0A2Z2KQC7_9BACL|nr:hypothetical protein [Paenibacillus donghaensis]ASA26013.1 hypothetical protein B9T62_38085 [Paenibacillus donghaensis]